MTNRNRIHSKKITDSQVLWLIRHIWGISLSSHQIWIEGFFYPEVKFAGFRLLKKILYRSILVDTKAASRSRKPIVIWLIASQVLALLSLIFWLVITGLSVMAFDSGVTTEAWTFVIAIWSYPIWPLGFAIAAWIAYARKKDRLAGILTTFTFLPVLVLIVILAGSSFFYSIGL
jgi:hypothetical protein